MKNNMTVIVFLLGTIFMLGCQTVPYQPYARKVKLKPKKGGIVALKLDHREEDRDHAKSLMGRACGGVGFDIVEEGEVVVGTVTNSTEKEQKGSSPIKMGSLFGIPVTSGGTDPVRNTASETTSKKEWQMKFDCLTAKNQRSRTRVR